MAKKNRERLREEIASPELSSGLQDERLLTPKEAAYLLGASVQTLRWWRRSPDRGPVFVKVEGRIKYPLPALREYKARHTTARMPSPPFYRQSKIEELGEKHPGLREFIEVRQRRRVPHRVIAAEVLSRWGEKVSPQVLSNFYRSRVWPKELSERREGRQ